MGSARITVRIGKQMGLCLTYIDSMIVIILLCVLIEIDLSKQRHSRLFSFVLDWR